MLKRFFKIIAILGALWFCGMVLLVGVVAFKAYHQASPGDEFGAPNLPDIVAQDTPPNLDKGGMNWNDAEIAWWPYEEGMAQAKKKNAPIFFIRYASWCSDCHRLQAFYTHTYFVELSKRFVMIREDVDASAPLRHELVSGHNYIPRLLFLSPQGTLLPVTSGYSKPNHEYFYDSLEAMVSSMHKALGVHPSP